MEGKKAQSEMWWIIIGAAIAIIVFLVLFFIIIPNLTKGGGTITGTSMCEVGVIKGECSAEKQEGKLCLDYKERGCPEYAQYCCYTT
jgi:competence protein ComGC